MHHNTTRHNTTDCYFRCSKCCLSAGRVLHTEEGHLLQNPPPPSFLCVLSLLHLPLSQRVSLSGHPAHHSQMAKESPQLCLSASQLCAVHDLLKDRTVGPPCMHAHVCLCVVFYPKFFRPNAATKPPDQSSHLSAVP